MKRFRTAGLATIALAIAIGGAALFAGGDVTADSETIDFDAYALGTINGQDGWSSLGAAGAGCAVYDHAVVASGGGNALRLSNAVTSGCFSDQTFSKSLSDEAGETVAVSDGWSGGTRQTGFRSEFTLSSTVPGAQQPGLVISVSPDRGDGARMSYLRFEDQADGIHVFFDDYVDAAPFGAFLGDPAGCTTGVDDFVETDIATLDRSVAHAIKFVVQFNDGVANDVVDIYIDNVLEITGTTWEDYFRYCEGNETRTVDSMLFRSGGANAPATLGNGFLVDDLELTSTTFVACTTDCYVDAATGDDLNGGDTPATAKKTIQAAVDQVSVGGTVHVADGTYNENVSVSKRITIEGAGSGPADTVVDALASGSPAIDINGDLASGTSASDRLVLKDLRVTGATGGSGGGNSGVRVTGSASVSNVTFNNVAAVSNTGSGIAWEHTGSTSDVVVDFATLSNNGNAGFRIASSTASFNGLTIDNSTVENNALHGFITGPSGSPGVTNVTVEDSTFTGNGTASTGGEADLQFFLFNGNATLRNLVITGDAHQGIQLRGKNAPFAPSGTVLLDNVQVLGSPKYGIEIIGYSNVLGMTFQDVEVNTTGDWGIYFESIESSMNLGNTTLHPSSAFADLANNTQRPIDATGVTFVGAADNFAIEDRVGHAIDFAGLGLVTWVPNNVYVTVNSFTPPFFPIADIQRGVNAVASGGNVNVGPGTFTNNVVVNKTVDIIGQGQGVTVVQPFLSGPNPCSGASLCPGASNLFLVQANDVEIRDLTADGDNPALTSGIVQSGADLDARNGIITNHQAGVFQNLHVHDVTVKNIYLRGIYASSGGSFVLEDNDVSNVKGEFASIGIFNFGGSGVMQNNTVDDANDAIASNWSTGTQYLGNSVTNSGSGVHSDNNGGSGGVADLIQGNDVSNCAPGGYGVWTFASYRNITVQDNTVTNCAVGLAAAGQQAAVTSSFLDNEVDGAALAGSTGVYTTTSLFGFGSSNGNTYFSGNKIVNATDGFYIESEPGFTNKTVANFNEISGHSNSGATAAGAGTFDVDLAGNWWGNDTGPAHALNTGGTANAVTDDIAYSPWVGFGDASGATGFQLASPMTWFANVDVCYGTCVQRAVDFSSNGDTVKAKTGVFPEHVIVNKSITLTSASLPVIDGGGSGDVVTITADNATVSNLEIRNGANALVIASGADNATVTGNELNTFTSAGLRGNASTGQQINGNTITGPHTGSCVGGFWGMFLQDVGGTVDGNTISGIGNGLTTGCQEGRAIEAKGSSTIAITDNDISQYQKSGIIVRDTVNATITGNTTAGEGPTSAIAMNGITITGTGTTIISGNHTSGHRYNPEPTQSCGILLFGNTATVSGNDSTSDEIGICAVGGNGTQIANNTVDKHSERGIYVDGALNVLVDDNDIDGQGSGTTASSGGANPDNDTRYYGIYAIDSTGTIEDNGITGITHGPANGTQSGVGIRLSARAGQTSDMDILRNTLTDYQKNGMVITNVYGGASVHADIDDNTVTGSGPVNYIAQNGIQVSNGASANITNNDVSGHDYTPFTFAAVGLLIIDAADGGIVASGNDVHDNMEGMYVQQTDEVDVSNNTFTDNYDASIFVYLSSDGGYHFNTFNGVPASSTGVYIYDSSSDNEFQNNDFLANAYGVIVDYFGGAPLANHIVNNDFIGNTQFGVLQLDTLVGPDVDAEDNWWNACDGPSGAGPGSGDAVSTGVDFTPFEHGFCDSDNDLLTDDAESQIHLTDFTNPDTDGDGCADGEEVLFLAVFGGERDPLEFFDFFDVTGDQAIDLSDAVDILDYFGDDGTGPAGNLRDRSQPFPLQPWRTGESNDGVDLTDALVNLDSFGHSCQAAP